MTANNLATILKQAKETKQPYPLTFQQLKDAGVEMYEIHLATYENTYKGIFGIWSENSPVGYSPLTLSDTFSRDTVIDAIKRHQRGETTFGELLFDLANAGVSHYRVSMDKRTVTYYDANEVNAYEEQVP